MLKFISAVMAAAAIAGGLTLLSATSTRRRVINAFNGFRRITAICGLETAFWAPLFFLPVVASLTVDVQPPNHAYAYALYGTAVLAVVGAYFHRYFLAFRLSAFVVLGLGTFVATGIALARLGNSQPTYIISAIIDTDAREAAEFVNGTYGGTAYLLEAALLFPLISLVIQWRKRLMLQRPNAVPGIILALLFVLFMFYNGILYSPFMSVMAKLPEPLPLYLNVVPSLRGRAEISAIAATRAPIVGVNVIEPRHEPRTYVVVIGESASKYHMHLYGYHRPTTSNLDAMAASHELLVFSNVVTSHAATVPALTEALTVPIGQQKERRTIIDVLNAAGFKTYWLSNQSAPVGDDSAVALLTKSASEHQWVRLKKEGTNLDQRYEPDGALLPYVYDVLAHKEYREDKVLFIHLMGNHGGYQFRYPTEEKTFSNLQNPGCLSADEAATVNEYDNSVHYTDYILNQIIAATRGAGGESFVLYFGDHGEEVYDYRKFRGHYDEILSPYMAEVPLLLWLSPRYRQHYPMVAASIAASSNRPLWTGDLSYALADLAHINFPGMDPSKSFFSRQFEKRIRVVAGLDYEAFREAWRPDTAHANYIKLNGCATEAQAASPSAISPGTMVSASSR
jgi:heptose-I-phosphate ethanolaminephosphotransferase